MDQDHYTLEDIFTPPNTVAFVTQECTETEERTTVVTIEKMASPGLELKVHIDARRVRKEHKSGRYLREQYIDLHRRWVNAGWTTRVSVAFDWVFGLMAFGDEDSEWEDDNE